MTLTTMQLTFTQEGNTMGTTSDSEEMTVELECQTVPEEGVFYVLKTDGWSVDDVGELDAILQCAEAAWKAAVTKSDRIL